LRAYPTLLRVGFAEVVAYRAEFVVWILTTNMPFVMLAIWHAVAADGAVGRFDQSRFVAYYLGAWVVRLVTSTWVVWEMSMDIRNGSLAPRLLRPLHVLLSYSAEHLAAVPMRFLVVSPVVVLLLVSARQHLTLGEPGFLLVFLLSLVGAWMLIFFSMVLMGALAFYLESSLGLFELWLGLHAILSGYLVPSSGCRAGWRIWPRTCPSARCWPSRWRPWWGWRRCRARCTISAFNGCGWSARRWWRSPSGTAVCVASWPSGVDAA